MQIRIPLHTKMATIKSDNNMCWQKYGEIGTLTHRGENVRKMVQLLWNSLAVHQKSKQLSNEPEIPLLGVNQKEMDMYVCTHMFTKALFIIAKRCGENPTVHEKQNSSVLCSHTGCHHCTTKGHGALTYSTTWKTQKTWKTTYCWDSVHLERAKPQTRGARGWREEWDRLSSGVMEVLEPGGPRLYNVLNPLSGTL